MQASISLACIVVAILALTFKQIPRLVSAATIKQSVHSGDKHAASSHGHERYLSSNELKSNSINDAPASYDERTTMNHYDVSDSNNIEHERNDVEHHYPIFGTPRIKHKIGDERSQFSQSKVAEHLPIKSVDRARASSTAKLTPVMEHEEHEREHIALDSMKRPAPCVEKLDQVLKLFKGLQASFVEQVIRQRVADKDHLLMEKWLVDNINDLHRELKQTEMDFEHYVQVTKSIIARNEQQLRRQLARQTSLPLSIAIPTSSNDDNYSLMMATTMSQQQIEATASGQRNHLASGNQARNYNNQLGRMFRDGVQAAK